MRPYLLISPRGQAKTWELVTHAIKQSFAGDDCIIFCHSSRIVSNTKEKIRELSERALKNIEVTNDITLIERAGENKIRYFDEFDLLNLPDTFEVRDSDRFYGTPKKRNLLNWPKEDILYKILQKTKGYYESRMWSDLYDQKLLKRVVEQYNEKVKEEFIGNPWILE